MTVSSKILRMDHRSEAAATSQTQETPKNKQKLAKYSSGFTAPGFIGTENEQLLLSAMCPENLSKLCSQTVYTDTWRLNIKIYLIKPDRL